MGCYLKKRKLSTEMNLFDIETIKLMYMFLANCVAISQDSCGVVISLKISIWYKVVEVTVLWLDIRVKLAIHTKMGLLFSLTTGVLSNTNMLC